MLDFDSAIGVKGSAMGQMRDHSKVYMTSYHNDWIPISQSPSKQEIHFGDLPSVQKYISALLEFALPEQFQNLIRCLKENKNISILDQLKFSS